MAAKTEKVIAKEAETKSKRHTQTGNVNENKVQAGRVEKNWGKSRHKNQNDAKGRFKTKAPSHLKQAARLLYDIAKRNEIKQKKMDWNQYKSKVKTILSKRKESRDGELITKLKKLDEQLRIQNIQGGQEKRLELVDEMFELMQGQCEKIVHDKYGSRIIEHVLKYAPDNIRTTIAEELLPSIINLMKSRYSNTAIKLLFLYANSEVRNKCLKALQGNAFELMKHANSAELLEIIYTKYTNTQDKINFMQEFWGPMYKFTKDPNVKCMRDIYKETEHLKDGVLSCVKKNINAVINKGFVYSSLLHSVMLQYLDECNEESRTELVAEMIDHIPSIWRSADGAQVILKCFWMAQNKDKKALIKAVKETVIEMAMHEHGHVVMLGILDATDDTVFLNKVLLTQILASLDQLLSNVHGREVLSWLIKPYQGTFKTKEIYEKLKIGRDASTAKKEAEIRSKEIRQYCIESFLSHMKHNIDVWCKYFTSALAFIYFLENADISLEQFLSLLPHFCDYLQTNPEWKFSMPSVQSKKRGYRNRQQSLTALEVPNIHAALMNLAHNHERGPLFAEYLSKEFTYEAISGWVRNNRPCKLISALYDCSSDQVKETFKDFLCVEEILNLLTQEHSKAEGVKLLFEQLGGNKIEIREKKKIVKKIKNIIEENGTVRGTKRKLNDGSIKSKKKVKEDIVHSQNKKTATPITANETESSIEDDNNFETQSDDEHQPGSVMKRIVRSNSDDEDEEENVSDVNQTTENVIEESDTNENSVSENETNDVDDDDDDDVDDANISNDKD